MKNQMKRMAAFLLALVMCFTLLPVNAKAAAKVKLNTNQITVYTGGSKTLKVTGTGYKAKWTSSNKTIATVSKTGKVTAKKAGRTVITAKVGSQKLTCRVTVKKENLKLNKRKASVFTGGSVALQAAGTSRKVTWTSSNKAVATVSKTGKVTAKKAGTATITASVGTKKSGMKKAVCKVTVRKENLKISSSKFSITEGNTKTIKASGIFFYERLTYLNRKVKWTSSNKSVAEVKTGIYDEKYTFKNAFTGKAEEGYGGSTVATRTDTVDIVAKKPGTATITCTVSGGKTLKCKVTVKKMTEAQKSKVDIWWNGEKTLKAEGAVGKVDWETGDKSIVSVESTGMNEATLTGKKVGKAVVTAKVNGKTFKKYTVTVKMKTSVLTKQEQARAFSIMDKYGYPDSAIWMNDELGITEEQSDSRLWNTHKKALVMARKLLPGRDVHFAEFDTVEKHWKKTDELRKKNVRYVECSGIAHMHGKKEMYTVIWVE